MTSRIIGQFLSSSIGRHTLYLKLSFKTVVTKSPTPSPYDRDIIYERPISSSDTSSSEITEFSERIADRPSLPRVLRSCRTEETRVGCMRGGCSRLSTIFFILLKCQISHITGGRCPSLFTVVVFQNQLFCDMSHLCRNSLLVSLQTYCAFLSFRSLKSLFERV